MKNRRFLVEDSAEDSCLPSLESSLQIFLRIELHCIFSMFVVFGFDGEANKRIDIQLRYNFLLIATTMSSASRIPFQRQFVPPAFKVDDLGFHVCFGEKGQRSYNRNVEKEGRETKTWRRWR